jgi:hypothetical protein
VHSTASRVLNWIGDVPREDQFSYRFRTTPRVLYRDECLAILDPVRLGLTIDLVPRLIWIIPIESNILYLDLWAEFSRGLDYSLLILQCDNPVLTGRIRGADLERDLLSPCGYVTCPE